MMVDEDFAKVPFGAFSWLSFAVVSDWFLPSNIRLPTWPAAIVTGALYNLVAYRTRSLGSCVLAHARDKRCCSAIYVLHTRQWGFW